MDFAEYALGVFNVLLVLLPDWKAVTTSNSFVGES